MTDRVFFGGEWFSISDNINRFCVDSQTDGEIAGQQYLSVLGQDLFIQLFQQPYDPRDENSISE